MPKLYYVMHKDFAEPILSTQPKAAQYDDKKLILTSIKPKNFDGEVLELYKLGFAEQECDVTLVQVLTGLANRANFTEDDLANIEKIHANGGLSPTLLTGLIDYMRSDTPTGKLIIINKSQAKWLYENHDSFKPVAETI